jgi:hypothetical protein
MKTAVELFIEPENQTLLWDIIHMCPIFSLLPYPEVWFASIIEEVYNKATEKATEGSDEIPLIQLNEFALFQMLTELKEIAEQTKIQKGEDPIKTDTQDTMHMQRQQQEPSPILQLQVWMPL